MTWYYISWMAGMLCNVIVRCRRWAHAPVIHATSHFYHEKMAAWVSISMHTGDPVPIVLLWGSAWRPFGPPELRYDSYSRVNILIIEKGVVNGTSETLREDKT